MAWLSFFVIFFCFFSFIRFLFESSNDLLTPYAFIHFLFAIPATKLLLSIGMVVRILRTFVHGGQNSSDFAC